MSIPMAVTVQTEDLRGMMMLLLQTPPRTLRAVRGGSAAGPSHSRHFVATRQVGRFSNRPFEVKHFQTIRTAMSMSLTGSRFSSESAPGPFHHGIRGRGGTIFRAALRCRWQVQATKRTHLIHRPARDIFPLLGGSRIFSYRV